MNLTDRLARQFQTVFANEGATVTVKLDHNALRGAFLSVEGLDADCAKVRNLLSKTGQATWTDRLDFRQFDEQTETVEVVDYYSIA
jgi:hypothetical protein